MNWTLDVKIWLFYLDEIQILTNQNSRFELKKYGYIYNKLYS